MKTTKPNWAASKKLACSDENCRLIALAIRRKNLAGEYCQTSHLAFRDRVQEIGASVPNDAYWGILLGVVIDSALSRV